MTAPADILVVGAGPTGLALALQAHVHGAQVRIVDRRTDPFRPSRALILHPRTLEVLRPFGVTDALLAAGDTDPTVTLHLGRREVPVHLGRFEIPATPFPPLTLIRQMEIERVLAEALARRGVDIERGVEAIAVADIGNAARTTLRGPDSIEQVHSDVVVGCDGPESIVRHAARIGWNGGPYREEIVLADLQIATGLDAGTAHAAIGRGGLCLLFPLGERAPWRLLATRATSGNVAPFGQPGAALPMGDLQRLLDAAGLPARIEHVAWSARYRVQHRLADTFQRGRLFIAGDAAHAYSPATGQGLNTGVQDAVNLGWKLALAPRSRAPNRLLASYTAERRPAAREALARTHLAFWLETGIGPLSSTLRSLVPLAAPIAPMVLSQRRLLGAGLAWLAGLRRRDASSPIHPTSSTRRGRSLRTGTPLPDTQLAIDGTPTTLHALTASPGVHLFAQRDAAIPTAARGPLVHLHRLDAPGDGVLAVHPDGVIGAVTTSPDDLRDWLHLVGATT